MFSAPIDQLVNDTSKVKVMDWIPKETHNSKTYSLMSLCIQFYSSVNNNSAFVNLELY